MYVIIPPNIVPKPKKIDKAMTISLLDFEENPITISIKILYKDLGIYNINRYNMWIDCYVFIYAFEMNCKVSSKIIFGNFILQRGSLATSTYLPFVLFLIRNSSHQIITRLYLKSRHFISINVSCLNLYLMASQCFVVRKF